MPAIKKRPPGNTTGRVVINSCNFIKVITEPEKEVQPTITVKTVATIFALEGVPSALKFRYSTMATNAAAPPPTPLNSATSCGICVI